VPGKYFPGSRHGWQFWVKHKNTNKTQLLASNYHTVSQYNSFTMALGKWIFQNPERNSNSLRQCVAVEMDEMTAAERTATHKKHNKFQQTTSNK
jgi:hypothetical protein